MIQQIESEEEDDDIIDNETVDEAGSDINAGASDTEDQSSVDEPRAAVGSAMEWRVVSIKPGCIKAADYNQYVD